MGNKTIAVGALFVGLITGLMRDAASLTWPIDASAVDYQRITGTFGEYKQTIRPNGQILSRFHRGIDSVPAPCENALIRSAVGNQAPPPVDSNNPYKEYPGYVYIIYHPYSARSLSDISSEIVLARSYNLKTPQSNDQGTAVGTPTPLDTPA